MHVKVKRYPIYGRALLAEAFLSFYTYKQRICSEMPKYSSYTLTRTLAVSVSYIIVVPLLGQRLFRDCIYIKKTQKHPTEFRHQVCLRLHCYFLPPLVLIAIFFLTRYSTDKITNEQF